MQNRPAITHGPQRPAVAPYIESRENDLVPLV
jgi:hypothetical protein